MKNGSYEPTIVVVDDDEVIRYTLQRKLSRLGYNIISLGKAEDALYLLKNEDRKIDLIITDIKLRKMDGIELLRYINAIDNPIPTLIITGQGNIEDAIRALRYGAYDFIRKPFDMNEVASTVRGILRRRQDQQLEDTLGEFIAGEVRDFILPVDAQVADSLSCVLTRYLTNMGICNKTTSENIAMAIREALSNALYHGNLEIPSDIREERGIKGFNEEIEKRIKDDKYRHRLVTIHYELKKEYVEYIIEDEGNGFDYESLSDPRDPENFMKDSGRGLLIIRIHMDEVTWSNGGRCIRMRKYRTEGQLTH